MGLMGKLEDVALPEILQVLALTGKTGKLVLSSVGGNALIVVREGRIIYAASNSARETIGHLLVCRGMVDEDLLLEALSRQHVSREERRLGAILVDMGAISWQALALVVREQVEAVVRELFGWRSGFFKFEPLDIAEHGEVAVDLRDLLFEQGVDAEQVVLGLTAKIDRAGLAEAVSGTRSAAEPPRSGEELKTLKELMLEIRTCPFIGEVTLRIARYAREVVRRGVFFMVRDEAFAGIAHFGLDLPGRDADEVVRGLVIPLGEASVLQAVVGERRLLRRPLEPGRWNQHLATELGGHVPAAVLAAPLFVSERVAAVLYGDNAPDDEPIGPTEGLELLLIDAGLALEKSALESWFRDLEDQLFAR